MLQAILQLPRQLTWREAVFSAKSFVAAMLALYLAFRLDFSQPMWSVTTVYIVAQPLAGMVLAKSFYRVLGTFIGAAASLLFVALFSNSPELFCLALALWMGLGTAITLYLRDAPAAYAGMLSGYSAAIIGLPAALAPETAFDFAVARCLEITLGIGCATLMHHVVFPQRAGDALRKALDATLPSLSRWAGDALRGHQSETQGLTDRRRILSAVVALDTLRIYAVLDTPAFRAMDPTIRQFEGKLMSLLAMLMSVYDRFALLVRDRPATSNQLRPLLERAADHMAQSAAAKTPEDSHDETEAEIALRADIEASLPTLDTLRTDASAFLVRSVLLRLRDLLELWRDAVWIRTHILTSQNLPGDTAAPAFRPYRDVTTAILGGMVTAATVLAASAFWIFSAWPNGTLAVTFAGIICAIVAARDDAAAASAVFLKMSFVGAIIAAIYVFAILPPITDFTTLVVALAPFYLACGALLAIPAVVPLVMPIIFIGGGLLSLTNTMTYDFAAFCNNAFGYIVGIAMGVAGLSLLRPLRTDWPVERLMRGALRDLADVAGTATIDRTGFESRMFDRINALFARLDPMVAGERALIQSGLAGLRLGLNIIVLRETLPEMPAQIATIVRQTLETLADSFGRMARGRQVDLPSFAIETASRQILDVDENPVTTLTAESLYNIALLLRQHPILFGPTVPSDAPASLHPVTA